MWIREWNLLSHFCNSYFKMQEHLYTETMSTVLPPSREKNELLLPL